MKIVGIVAEFNPLHNGHKYIIDYARNELNADYIVIAMSGDYVQRGEPAIFDKWVRTKAALITGADAVFMLPVTISTASANYYALGSVALLDNLGCTHILFGSENGNIEDIKKNVYVSGIIDSPNNILAREYLNAIKTLNLKIEPITIKRQGSNYNDLDNIIDNKCSASYIRNHFAEIFNVAADNAVQNITSNHNNVLDFASKCNNNFELSSNHNDVLDSVSKYNNTDIIPSEILDNYKLYLTNNSPVFPDQFSDMLLSQLINNSNIGFNKYFDIFDDLSDKIVKNICSYTSFTEFTDLLKSKDITRSHLSRALLHICLDITKSDIDNIKALAYAPYGRLLGFRKNSDILTILSKTTKVEIVSKLADYINILKVASTDKAVLKLNLLAKDMNASHLYSYHSNNKKIINECQQRIIIV